MTEHDPEIEPSYAIGQLAASLRAADAHTDPALRARAEQRAQRWRDVIRDLVSGALRVGQRKPHADMPVWATPLVLRGGFASGAYAAGGELAPHERDAIAGDRSLDTMSARRAANGAMLTEPGRATLRARLADRTYRIDVPEEGALLALEWLIARGERASAAQLLDVIEPYFDRLRFHGPRGTPVRVPSGDLDTPVLLSSGHEVAQSLRTKQPAAAVETMREAVEVWAPLTDAAVALLLETVEGDLPGFTGAPRRATGKVCARLPEGFAERRARWLAAHAEAREAHTRCKRPHRRGEVLGTLHRALAASDDPRTLPAPLVAQVRERLAGFVTAYGAPGSERHATLRASQAVGPSHARLGHLVAERITRSVPEHDGIADLEAVLAPLSGGEASEVGASAGHPLPEAIWARVSTATEAPITALIEQGLVRSGEVLATLLPQLSGDALALRFDGDDARALYAASYRAFRRRRGLLLLWLQHQVRFSELPWIAAMEACADRGAEELARACLRQVAALAIRAFPATITPNKLVTELSALAAQAGLGASEDTPAALPLVEEIASDIFMGTFSAKFLRAARIAGRVVSGSIYARYYGVPYERVATLEGGRKERWGVVTSPAFDALCVELAGAPSGGNRQAQNGMIIEAASILTTHNLAALVSVLELDPLLPWRELTDRAYAEVLELLERRVLPERQPYRARLHAYKTLAFAWRQMLFFLSRTDDVGAFLVHAREALGDKSPLAQQRLAPHLDALADAASGRVVPRESRLLGWCTQRPPLLGPARS